jgi:DNA-directed RNA polymerase beta' subunit
MLSGFLKKLMFARQFLMMDGKIEVLGKKQVMLPADVAYELQKGISNNIAIKKVVQKNIEDIAKKVGSGQEGLLKNISEIFETYGLGKMQIVNLDNKNKKCILRITNSPVDKYNEEFQLLTMMLSGTFSFLFSKDAIAEMTSKGTNYFEYSIK